METILLLEELSSELFIYRNKDEILSVLRSEYPDCKNGTIKNVSVSDVKVYINRIDRDELLKQLREMVTVGKTTAEPATKEKVSDSEPAHSSVLSPEIKIYKKFTVERTEETFVIPENMESLLEFLDEVVEGKLFIELNDFVNKSAKRFRYMKTYNTKLTQYTDDIKKLKNKVHEKSLEKSTSNLQYYPARETAEKMLSIFNSYLLNGIIRSVESRLTTKDEDEKSKQQLDLLLEKFNIYISSIGIYTYTDAEPGKLMSDDDYEYYNVDSISMSDENLIGIIKSVITPPYMMSFELRGKTDFTYIMGSALVYSE